MCREAVAREWKALKFKVGMDAGPGKKNNNLKRCHIAREELGPDAE